jgi:hypothetical protein
LLSGRRWQGTSGKMIQHCPVESPAFIQRGTMRKPGKRNKKNQIGEPFVPTLKYMIHSPAYKKITNASRVAYLLLKSQCKESNQKEVIFPYSHAEQYMTRHTFARSINQLIELGFIKKTSFGGCIAGQTSIDSSKIGEK